MFPEVAAALRGDPGACSGLDDPEAQRRFLEQAAAHRVKPLLVRALRTSGALQRCPEPVRDALLGAARAEAALEIARQLELSRVMQAFASAGIGVLLIKGAALAYTVYPEPWLRPREDTDLLVRSGDADRARAVLGEHGYRAVPRQSGRLVTNQQLYLRAASPYRDAVDLHWKIADPPPFADLLSTDELFGTAGSATVSSSCVARVPSRGHALLLACWHRVAHHHDADRLLWLYDVHLLAASLGEPDRRIVVEIATRTRTADACAGALSLAVRYFESPAAAALLAQLPPAGGRGPASGYLRADARKVDLLVADLRALPRWSARARLLREHLFPPRDYMVETYGRRSRVPLPALYAWRIVAGLGRWIRRPR